MSSFDQNFELISAEQTTYIVVALYLGIVRPVYKDNVQSEVMGLGNVVALYLGIVRPVYKDNAQYEVMGLGNEMRCVYTEWSLSRAHKNG